MKEVERLGNSVGVPARMLDVVAHGLAIGTEIDHDIVADDAIVDRRPWPQLDVQAVRRGVVVELGAHSLKSLSLNTLWTVSPSGSVTFPANRLRQGAEDVGRVDPSPISFGHDG